MPRKSKTNIAVIPVDQPEGLAQAWPVEEEVKTDAQEMTDIVKNIDNDTHVVEEEPKEESKDEPIVEVKPKVTRKPRAKKEAKPSVDTQEPEPIEPESITKEFDDEPKDNNKVECPDCGKLMSAKTLRYSHRPNCVFKKMADKEEAQMTKIPEEVIEAEVQKRMSCAKTERLNRRQKQIESLVAQAF